MHPEYGYYQKQNPFGAQGDFITAPEISQVFGELLGIFCADQWLRAGSPSPAIVVEMGPGRGTLMQDFLRGTRHVPGFHQAISVHLIEASAALTAAQKKKLQDSHPSLSWHKDIFDLPKQPMFFVANELCDALPIHQFEKTQQGWGERMVALDAEEALCFTLVPSALSERLNAQYPEAQTGEIIETSPASIQLIHHIADHLNHHGGAAALIDYGYDVPSFRSSLQAVKSHQYHSVLEDIGEADITAHVDFAALAEEAKRCRRAPQLITQAAFLKGLGVDMRLQQLLQKAENPEIVTSAVQRLIDPEQMGELFKVLLL